MKNMKRWLVLALDWAAGLAGIFLGRKWRAVIVLPLEALSAALKHDLAETKAEAAELKAGEAKTMAASVSAKARAEVARDRADELKAEREARDEAVRNPTPSDLRALRFRDRYRARARAKPADDSDSGSA